MAEAPDPNENPFNFQQDESFDEDSVDDNVKQVGEDTEKVFKSFVFTRLTSHIDKEATEGDLNLADIPSSVMDGIRNEKEQLEKLQDGENDPSQKHIIQLGSQLAALGDEIQNKYHDEFSEMLKKLNLTQDLAFDVFANIAGRLFDNGINWGRIIALFCFGYEMAVNFIRRGTQGIRSFLQKIVRYIVSFFYKKKIAEWVASQGGWASFNFQENYDYILKGGAALTLIAAIIYGLYRYNKGS